jgi:hypothetical protein
MDYKVDHMRTQSVIRSWGGLFIFCWSLLVQLTLVGTYLDNDVVNKFEPTAADAKDYFRLADVWQESGFENAFGSGMRVPGYPAIILFLQQFFGENTPFTLRIVQMLLLAFSYLVILKVIGQFCGMKISISLVMLFSLLPLWHFVPILTAELLSSVSYILLTGILIKFGSGPISNLQFSSIVAISVFAIYLKPNNALLLLSVVLYLWCRGSNSRFKDASRYVIMVFLCLLPWLVFIQQNQSTWSLTTGSGINLLTGTGRDVVSDGTVLAQAAIGCAVADNFNPESELASPDDLTYGQVNNLHQQTAIKLWKESFSNHVCFGFQKVLIAFGFKANSNWELVYGVITVVTILVSLLSLGAMRLKAIGIYFLSFLFLLGILVFLFQADRRFTAPFVLPMFMICSALAIDLFKLCLSSKFTFKEKFHEWRNH